jgi:tetratricopeptide (TPR) repeat protein
MPVDEVYRRQVALLLKVVPLVALEPSFALKGGTAINLFLRDMPRLSVDLDLTYVPVKDRASSLKDIDEAMRRIAKKIEGGVLGTQINASAPKGEKGITKLVVRADNAQIKIEVTPVLRGCVYEPVVRQVSASVEAEFGFAEMSVVSFADLYAGKIVAALDRQHPPGQASARPPANPTTTTPGTNQSGPPKIGMAPGSTPTAATAQPTNPPYLAEFPSVERVKSEMQGKDAMDTAARQMGAFWQLQEIIKGMSGLRWTQNALTSDEKRLLGQYAAGYQAAGQPYANYPDRPTWYRAHAFYETNRDFRDELFRRLLTPTIQAQWAQITGDTRARVEASKAQRQAQAAATAQSASASRGDEAAQAVGELIQGMVSLAGPVISQTQASSQPGTTRTSGGPAAVYVKEGDGYLGQKDFAHALESYKKAAALDGNNGEAFCGQAAAFYGLKDYQSSVAAGKRCVTLKPDYWPGYRNLGLAHDALGQYQDSIRVYREELRLKEPNPEQTHRLLGEACYGLERYPEAVSEYKEALRLDPKLAVAYKDLAAAYAHMGQWQQANQTVAALRKIDPKKADELDHDINVYAASADFKKERSAQAQPGTAKPAPAAAKAQREPYEYRVDAVHYLGRKNYEKAIEAYKKVIEMEPGFDADSFLVFMGMCDERICDQRLLDEAEKQVEGPWVTVLKAHVAAHPNDTVAFLMLGDAQEMVVRKSKNVPPAAEQARHNDALAAYRRTIALKPPSALLANAWFRIGTVYQGMKQDENAVSALTEVVRLQPENSTAMAQLGHTLYTLKRYPGALEAYQRWKRLTPNLTGASFYVGRTLNAMKQYDKAVDELRVFATSQHSDAHYELGVAYRELGQYPSAISAFQQAIRLKEKNKESYSEAVYGLGMTYLKMGQKEQALQVASRLQALDKAKAQQLKEQVSRAAPAAAQPAATRGVDGSKPGAPTPSANSGTAYVKAGDEYSAKSDYSKAVEAYKKALALDANNGDAYWGLGAALYEQKRFAEAVHPLQRAVRLRPDDNNALWVLGRTYVELGDKQAALRIYRTLVARAKDDGEKQDAADLMVQMWEKFPELKPK